VFPAIYRVGGLDRIWFCKFSCHDIHRSHAMYEEIKKSRVGALAFEFYWRRGVSGERLQGYLKEGEFMYWNAVG